jgi:hypothetical protein
MASVPGGGAPKPYFGGSRVYVQNHFVTKYCALSIGSMILFKPYITTQPPAPCRTDLNPAAAVRLTDQARSSTMVPLRETGVDSDAGRAIRDKEDTGLTLVVENYGTIYTADDDIQIEYSDDSGRSMITARSFPVTMERACSGNRPQRHQHRQQLCLQRARRVARCV